MSVAEILFWVGVIIIFYTYIGYAIILWLINHLFRKRKISAVDYFPPVTMVIPVFNEEMILEKKISNLLEIDYPPENITFLFVNDGSTDRTAEIISSNPRLKLVNSDTRLGKTAALNSAMTCVHTPFVVFTDANALLNKDGLKKLVRHYTNPSVGGVSGEKRIATPEAPSLVSNAENLYWNYESFLKKTDSDFYSIVGADGGLYTIRTELFEPVDPSVILDDFFISIKVVEKGLSFHYEPGAWAYETSSTTLKEEQKRKVRISAGCFQALFWLTHLLSPFRNLRLFILYISHRVLRWTLCPLLLPILFILNTWLAFSQGGAYVYFLLIQCGFYLLGLAGYVMMLLKLRAGVLMVPYYFMFMNFSLYLGFLRFVAGKQSVLWEKTSRILP